MKKIFARFLAAPALVLAVTAAAVQANAQDLERPDRWSVRFDDPSSSEADLEMFVEMPPGWHVTSGPPAVYWGPEMEASGDFRVEMEVFLFDPGQRREAFGVFVGGREMEGDAVEYSYFLIRNGGEFIVKRREGPEAPTVLPWAAHPAILSFEDREEGGATVKNVLVVEARGETVRFFVNDAEVASLPRAQFATDGAYGFRVNHGLNLHVSKLEMSPLL